MDRTHLARLLARYRKALLGAAFFMLALLLYWREIRRVEIAPARRYLTVKRNITAGTPVYLPDLAADLKAQPAVPGQLCDQDLAWLQGAQFRASLEAGAAVRWEDLLLSSKWIGVSPHIPNGLRAVEIETAGAGQVRPGDWLDLYQRNERGEFSLVAERVRVLDVDRKAARLSVGLQPDLVQAVQSAQAAGPLRVVVRNPNEQARDHGARWKKGRRKQRAPAIPVYVD